MSLALSLMLGLGAPPPKTYVEDVFSTFTYVGTSANRSIVNGVDLSGKGGMVWCKKRNAGTVGGIFDTARGIDKLLIPSSTAAEYGADASMLHGFNSDGFLLGNESGGNQIANYSGADYVSWTFRKAPKFFDFGTYTGNGTSGRQISHALGQAPGMVILKRTDTGGDVWIVHHRSLGTGQIYLNLTSAGDGGGDITATSSTTFTVANFSGCNQSGASYVWYAFAHDTGTDGLIQCGTFSTSGGGETTVTLPWEPQFVMWKKSNGTSDWYMLDTARGWTAGTGDRTLSANNSNAEGSPTIWGDPKANGFSLYGLSGSEDWVYMAIRAPMKVPTDATKVYTPLLRTGNGSDTTVSGVGFAPDVMFSQTRSSWAPPTLRGRLRGPQQTLSTAYTSVEATGTDRVYEMTMDGAKFGTHSDVNSSGKAYVHQFLKRAPGFMQEVCDTGTGSAHAIDHGLAVVPELMIRKGRSGATQWEVYSAAIANTEKLVLNSTAAKATDTTAWNSTTPTSTQFTVGTGANVNTNAATYDTLLFATCAGVSKVGSYTGTGTTLQINCGFAAGARFILIKRADSTGNWYVWDTVRGIVSGNDPFLWINTEDAENGGTDYIDPYSAGFEISSSAPAAINASGGTYIYLAIA